MPLLQRTLRSIAVADVFGWVTVAAPKARWDEIKTIAAAAGVTALELVEGGATRQESVRNGLATCGNADVVCIHDAARPFCPPRVFAAAVAAAASAGSSTAALAMTDTIKRVKGRAIAETLDRADLVSIQTPQAFLTGVLKIAHNKATDDGIVAADDCELVERSGGRVVTVEGDGLNIKVTVPADLLVARAIAAILDEAATPLVSE